MALINRLSRLFQADLHAVLDRVEEPDALLRQAVREMEEALEHDQEQVRLLKHEQRQLVARQTELEHSLAEIGEELDVCFESGKDNLARKLIKRKLEAQRFGNFLSRKRKPLEESLDGFITRIEENRIRLESMRQKAELLTGTENSDQPEEHWTPPDFPVHEEDVEVAFLREKQNRSRP